MSSSFSTRNNQDWNSTGGWARSLRPVATNPTGQKEDVVIEVKCALKILSNVVATCIRATLDVYRELVAAEAPLSLLAEDRQRDQF